jgi:hypothetical protein
MRFESKGMDFAIFAMRGSFITFAFTRSRFRGFALRLALELGELERWLVALGQGRHEGPEAGGELLLGSPTSRHECPGGHSDVNLG